MANKLERDFVRLVMRKHGDVLDIKKHPEVFIDILRSFRAVSDGGLPPGGVPPGPAPEPPPSPEPPPGEPGGPSPGPSRIGIAVTNDDLMRVILRLARDVDVLKKQLAGPTRSSSRKRAR